MNLILGDVVETIYVVDEDDEDEDIRVHPTSLVTGACYECSYCPADHYEEIRDALCSRFVSINPL
jgi:hypothetical protein